MVNQFREFNLFEFPAKTQFLENSSSLWNPNSGKKALLTKWLSYWKPITRTRDSSLLASKIMSIDAALATRPKVGCDVALFSSDLLPPPSEIWAADKGRIFPMSLPSTSIESETYRRSVSWISLFRLWCPQHNQAAKGDFYPWKSDKTVHLRPINNFLEGDWYDSRHG